MTMNTELKFKKDSKGNIERAIITGAKAYYTKVQKPAPIYEQRDMRNPTKTEYTVDLLVSEEVADEWDEVFTKQTATKLSKEKFKQRFKIEDDADLPSNDKKFFMIKAKQKAQKADGTPISASLRPRVVQNVGGNNVDITFDKLVGNGSDCDVLLRVNGNDFGTFAYLGMIKVTNLVEYNQSGGSGLEQDAEDFLGGSVEFADVPEDDGKAEPNQGGDDGQPPFEPDEQPDFGEDDDELY